MQNSKTLLNQSSEKKITPEELQEIHRLSLSILLDVKKLCDSSGLDYYLTYGSLLGAVRHKGFIPWDDDIDIAVPAWQLKEFVAKMKEAYPGKYTFAGLGFDDYGDPFLGMKIMIAGTKYVELPYEGYPDNRGIDIDVVPVVSLPKSRLGRKINGKRLQMLNHICAVVGEYKYSPVSLLHNKDKSVSRFYKIRRFLGFCFSYRSLKKWVKKYDKFMYKNYKNSNNIGEFEIGYFDKTPLTKDALKKIDVEFEGHKFSTFSNPEYFNISNYGSSYMDLPPVEKREIHPVKKLDLGTK